MNASSDELLRLRDKVHKLEKTVWAQTATLRELGKQLDQTGAALRDCRSIVDKMSAADDLAQNVATALRDQRRSWFNKWRRLGAFVAAVLLLGPAVHDLFVWFIG